MRLFKTMIYARQKYVPILDGQSPAKIAYSLRRLRTLHLGNCIRVRRSVDNAEQDIGFSSNLLDYNSLLSFIGSGDGFISKWYDQSGSGNDAIMTTLVSQPQVIASGNFILENSLPVIKFTTTTFMSFTGFSCPTGFSVYHVSSFKTGSPNYIAYIRNTPAVGSGFMTAIGSVANQFDTLVFYLNSIKGYGTRNGSGTSVPPTSYRVHTWYNNGTINQSGCANYINGGVRALFDESPNWGNHTTSGLNLGMSNNKGNLNIGEVIIFDFDNRSANSFMNNNMIKFYKIT